MPSTTSEGRKSGEFIRHRWHASAAAILVYAGLAYGQQPITIEIGAGAGNPGNAVELLIELTTGTTAPSAIVLFLEYDPEKLAPNETYYEFIQTDLEGNPVSVSAPARPESAAINAGKQVTHANPVPGRLILFILGLNANTIQSGPLATVALDVVSGGAGETLDVTGGAASSATAPDGTTRIPINFVDGSILVGCEPADIPTGVTATQGLPDRVDVSWNAVATPNAEYRVYRSTSDDPETATPLGTAWVAGTTFSDLSALPADAGGIAGCCLFGEPIPVQYYYWVKARTATGCESALSATPAIGYRGAGKATAADPVSAAADGMVLGVAAFLLCAHARRLRRAMRVHG